MKEISDEDLMAMYQNGNNMAFDLLFDKYRAPVFNFIYRMVNGDRTAAEDLLQNIFLKIAEASEYYQPKSKFSTWLFAIARNHCLNFLKSRHAIKQKNTVSMENRSDNTESTLGEQLPAKEDTGKAVQNKEMLDILDANISALPEKYRELFLLHAVEGLPFGEIAAITRVNAATARTNYRRARLLLLEKMKPFLITEGNA